MRSPFVIKIRAIVKEMRVWQWTKNVLVFAPLVFGVKLFNLNLFFDTVILFFAMSLAASTAYVINDIFDVQEDRKHSTKKNRPIASGLISMPQAKALVGTLVIVATALSLYLSPLITGAVLLYIVLNLLYSKLLKHRAIIDILIVAFFYIYRVYVGGLVGNLPVSGWLILTTFFLSLFMITGKRRAEIISISGKATRKVLSLYNEKFLDAALSISITLFMVFYSLYSILIQSGLFILTIFPIIYISLRYLYLIFVQGAGEEPEKLIFKDKEILLSGVVLGLLIVVALYFHVDVSHLSIYRN